MKNTKLFYWIIAFLMLAGCKKDNVTSNKPTPETKPKIATGLIKAIEGGTLETLDSIKMIVPAGALSRDVTVSVGIKGNEPTTIPNPDLSLIGTPFTFDIPLDSLKTAVKIIIPKPKGYTNSEECVIFGLKNNLYFPFLTKDVGNDIEITIDILNWGNSYKSTIGRSVDGSIITWILVAKQTPKKSQIGIKKVKVLAGKLSYEDITPVSSNSKILLMIHGWIGAPSVWEEFLPIFQQKTNSGYTEYWTFGYNSSLGISENAKILSALIKGYYNGANIDIVAHSMGGLVSRSAIENFGCPIKNLVTLGTPHLGSPLAALRYFIGFCIGANSLENLVDYNINTKGFADLLGTSAFIQDLKSHSYYPIPYHTIAAINDPERYYSLFGQSLIWPPSAKEILEGDDDGIVSVVSAKGVKSSSSPNVLINNEFMAHTKMTQNGSIITQVVNYLNEASPIIPLTIEKNEISLYLNETATIPITSGSGRYSIIQYIDPVATVEIVNNSIVIKAGNEEGTKYIKVKDEVSNEEKEITIKVKRKVDLNVYLSTQEVTVRVGEIFNVTATGMGMEDPTIDKPQIAQIQRSENTITIKGLIPGIATVSVKDRNTPQQIKNISVTVTPFTIVNLTLDKEAVSLKPGITDEINITQGSGDYTITPGENAIAAISRVSNAKIGIAGVSIGNTNITIKDNKTGQQKIVVITINPIVKMSLSAETITIDRGATAQITIIDGAGPYILPVEDPAIASVSQTGNILKITGLKAGVTKIVVKDMGLNQTKTILVTINPDPLSLEQETISLEATTSKTVLIKTGSGNYSVKSSNEQAATATVAKNTITINGVAEGTAIITVKDETSGKIKSLQVTVTKFTIVNLTLDKEAVGLSAGASTEVNITLGSGDYTITPGDNAIATVTRISNTKIGIAGVATGSTQVTVKDNKTGQQKVITVTVSPIYQMSLSPETVTINQGVTAQVSIINGIGPYNYPVTDPTIASVTQVGSALSITGLKPGTTTISVTDLARNQTLTLRVDVIESISLIDYEGNNYKVVKIGNQYWSSENLRSKLDNRGASISYYSNFPNITGEYRVLNAALVNMDVSTYNQHGLLYNVNHGNLFPFYCPNGWRYPTKADIENLLKSYSNDKFNSITTAIGLNIKPTGYVNAVSIGYDQLNLSVSDFGKKYILVTSTKAPSQIQYLTSVYYNYALVVDFVNKTATLEQVNVGYSGGGGPASFGYFPIRLVRDI